MILLVISDLHCGSSVGLMPPEFDTQSERGILYANRGQRWLWEQGWQKQLDLFHAWRGDRPFNLLVNGDAMEGNHHRTMQLVDQDPMIHLAIARHILMPVAEEADRTFLVRGTECHTASHESMLGRDLPRVVHDPQTGDPCWEQVQLEYDGIRIHVKHHMPTSQRAWTRSSSLCAQLIHEQATAVRHGHAPPRVVLRAHRHVHAEYRGEEGLFIAGPCLQLLTRYGRRVTTESLSCPGFYALDFAHTSGFGLPVSYTFMEKPEPDPVIQL